MTGPSKKQKDYLRSLLQDVGYPAPEMNPQVPALLARILGLSEPLEWSDLDKTQTSRIINATKKRLEFLNQGVQRTPAVFINPTTEVTPWTAP